jgi:hypothetical protein
MMDADAIEREVRRRLTEAAAAAGVPHSRAALEVLYLMPRGFLDQYTALFDAALVLPSSPSGGTRRAGELGKANSHEPLPGTAKGLRTNSGRNAGDAPHLGGGAAKKGPSGWGIKDTRALELKERFDKRLRALARDMRLDLSELAERGGKAKRVAAGPTRCAGCGRIPQAEWGYCPNCGGKLGGEGKKE